MEQRVHRIVFGYYSETWLYQVNTKEQLKPMSLAVTPEEFSQEMRRKVYCPECATPLTRTPADSSISTNSITAHFRHGSSKRYPESKNCNLRIKTPDGLKYVNEEDVKKAIEAKNLIVVSGWKQEPPTLDDDLREDGEYTKTAIEDELGPETLVPIGRHNGQEYSAPSHISTVMALCKDFPSNLNKGFYFPNSQYPMLLSDQLYPTRKISDDLPSKETLFFGVISEYRRLSFRHVVEVRSGDYTFKLYTKPEYNERKNLDATSVGRYILFSTKPYWESKQSIVAAKLYHWGAYSVLPRKYDSLIRQLEA
ncbi:hypothetical protein BCV44_04625 [Vibrio cyclitrophicus]|uniref:hypothetical protein n=1 Tax=Vibrio TaxID=662 RepID=UPI000C823249|nr:MULTISPECIES: hypothetical protein [Vibrio]PME09153.1 hypothetical protein BCV44_04625 [Vibrio cyclitrophicus]RLQ19910.1 hypothetical protein AYK60_07520 [Vibrio sp. SBT000027]